MSLSLFAKGLVVLASPLLFFSGCQDTYTSKDVVQSSADVDTEELRTRELLVGRWYGNQPKKDGGSHRFIKDKKRDGTYEITFRFCEPDGQYEEQTERGRWGHSRAIYFTIVEKISFSGIDIDTDAEDPRTYDAYEIISLDEDTFVYKWLYDGSVFTAKRVAEDFAFPGNPDRRVPTPPRLTQNTEKKKKAEGIEWALGPQEVPKKEDIERAVRFLSDSFEKFCINTEGRMSDVALLAESDLLWSDGTAFKTVENYGRAWYSHNKSGRYQLTSSTTFKSDILAGEKQKVSCDIATNMLTPLTLPTDDEVAITLNVIKERFNVSEAKKFDQPLAFPDPTSDKVIVTGDTVELTYRELTFPDKPGLPMFAVWSPFRTLTLRLQAPIEAAGEAE